METNEVIRLDCADVNFIATEVVLFGKLGENEVFIPDFVIYETDDKVAKVSVRLEDETVWLTQAHLVELFQSSKANISEHIKHIFEDGELNEISVVRKFRTTAADNKNYDMTYYNLDMIISSINTKEH